MIDPTREEWLAARERVLALWPHYAPGDTHWDKVVVAILGPCPPEPPPPHYSVGRRVVVSPSLVKGTVWMIYVGNITPDEAEKVAAALIEHARYAREQATIKEPDACGRRLVSSSSACGNGTLPCQRPAGHDGVCKEASA